MTPKFWLILEYEDRTDVMEFTTREELNKALDALGSSVEQLEVISGFSLAKRRRDGK